MPSRNFYLELPSELNGRYHLQRQIGQGGMGVVYQAHDETLNRDVAIKFLSPQQLADKNAADRFLREARAVARLSHPNIMTIHDIGQTEQWHYLILEYIIGQNLSDLLAKRGGTLPLEEATTIMRQCLAALAYAHEHGILHRDIKPENIMTTGDGRVKITDFGLALVRGDARLTQENAFMGTIRYLAPEYFNGQPVDARADLYALSAVWYELLTGQPPFCADSPAVTLGQIINDTAVPPSQHNNTIPPTLDAFILKLLAKEPDGRYQSANEALAALEKPTSSPSITLHVSLLGEFKLQFEETAVPALDSRCQTLLAYLILHRDTVHTRQHIAFQFWPDSTESQARTNLRNLIHKLRRALPEADQLLHLTRQTIQWRPDAPFSLDVAEFEQYLKIEESRLNEANLQSSIINLQNAITHYPGDLLPGHYDDWILAARERLRSRYLACLDQLILHLENERQYPEAIRYARRLLREDPLHEAAYRRLMRLQALNGNTAGALRTYHTCTTTLQRELGVFPSQATQAAYERLLNMDAPRKIASPARIPLVAREEAWATLQTTWRQTAVNQPNVVLLTGEAGIGKTRLAEELLDWTRRQGIPTLMAACYAAEGQLPYAPIANWLRDDALQNAFEQLEARWLIECARLRPELLVQRPDLTPPTPLTEGWQRQHFFTAVAHAILNLRQPLLLFIDDLQWCDQDSLDWSHFLLRFDPDARFLLLGTVRVEEVDSEHPLLKWQQSFHRAGTLTDMPLHRLNAAATNQLAAHVAQHSLDPDLAARVFAETEGNPLFIVETARAGFQFTVNNKRLSGSRRQPSVSNLPPKAQAVIEARLAQLSPLARRLTNLAAVIGHSFTFDLLQEASGEDEETAVHGLDEMWQRYIVREQGADSYDFSHDKIRQTAYASLSAARRRLLHRHVAQALIVLSKQDLDAVSGQIALHHEAAGQFAAAAHHYQRAGTVAQRIFAHQEAVHYLQRAIALLPRIKDEDGLPALLYEQLGDVLALMKRYEETQTAYETAVAHTHSAVDQARLHGKIGHTWNAQQKYEEAHQEYDSALQLLGEAPVETDTVWQQTWLDIQLERIDIFYFRANLAELTDLIADIKEPIDRYGSNRQKVIYLQVTNMLQFRLKRFRLDNEDVVTARRILALAEQSGDAHVAAVELFGLGFALLWSGQIETAVERLTLALRQSEQNGNVYLQDQCIAYLSICYRFQGNLAQVNDLAQRGLAISKLAQNVFYKGVAEANLAWISYREGCFGDALVRGEAAMALWRDLPFPLYWLALWPLLATAVTCNDWENAFSHAQAILHPLQQKLPDALTAVLQQAIAADEANQPASAQNYLQKSIQLAQEMGYL